MQNIFGCDTESIKPFLNNKRSIHKKKTFFLGVVTPDPKTHRDLLKTIWFSLYSRGRGKIGSSAFEHVFLTELRNGTVSGFHNWVYYYFEEKAGHADYQGYLKKVDLGTVIINNFSRKIYF